MDRGAGCTAGGGGERMQRDVRYGGDRGGRKSCTAGGERDEEMEEAEDFERVQSTQQEEER